MQQQKAMLPRRSKLYKASNQTKSLKTTVPSEHVELMELTEKDELIWEYEEVDGVKLLKVKKAKKEKKG